jgi:fucose 4-O-acetylase-like acetyltransferase
MVEILQKKSTTRRQDVDRAKGLAILFVVFGHIVARADPIGVDWYEPLRRAVYAFHMPFFLYLSGLVAVFSGTLFTPPKEWQALVVARARRLLIPFLALGLLIVCGKTIAQHLVFVDNQVTSLADGITDLLWHTQDSPALSIWYLFVLFTLSITSPLLIRANHGQLNYLLILGFLFYCVPLPPYVYLDHIGVYSIFFALGAFAASHEKKWIRIVDCSWHFLLLLWLSALALIAVFGKDWPVRFELLPVGILSMAALHGLVRHLPVTLASIFIWLGRNCFMIYLFNTLFIGLSKGLLLRVTDWNGSHFLFFAVILMTSGIFGPVLLRQHLFRRVKILERYTE